MEMEGRWYGDGICWAEMEVVDVMEGNGRHLLVLFVPLRAMENGLLPPLTGSRGSRDAAVQRENPRPPEWYPPEWRCLPFFLLSFLASCVFSPLPSVHQLPFIL